MGEGRLGEERRVRGGDVLLTPHASLFTQLTLTRRPSLYFSSLLAALAPVAIDEIPSVPVVHPAMRHPFPTSFDRPFPTSRHPLELGAAPRPPSTDPHEADRRRRRNHLDALDRWRPCDVHHTDTRRGVHHAAREHAGNRS